MLYKEYGRTGKMISRIAAGGMRLNSPKTDADIDAGAEVLLHAYGKGVNYFDTAPLYFDDRSEEMVGRAVSSMKSGTFYVSTKCSHKTAAGLRESLERSLKRLNVDRIHFFHIWCLMNPGEWRERVEGGAVEEAKKAAEEGLIEHLVFSTHMTGMETRALIEEGVFEGVTLGYNAINFPFREEGIAAAREAGIGVVTMNPLAGGLIPQHAQRFDFIRRDSDPDVVTAALRFNLSNPGITAALVGFNSKSEVDQAVAALDDFIPVDEDAMTNIRKQIEESFDGLCTGCGYCLPCPVGIPIPKYMDAFNMRILEGKETAVLDRLKWHWNIAAQDAGKCVSCGQCEEACTQHLPIMERLKSVAAIPSKSEK